MPKKTKTGKIKTKAKAKKVRVKDEHINIVWHEWIDWLWPVFSKYIRTRDCIKTTGNPLYGRCCTCGRHYPINKLQAGHFIPGRFDAILFDEEQVHTQCYRCNILLQGMWHKYYMFMLDSGHTHESIQEMIARCNDPVEFSREWFEQTYEYYEFSLKNLLEDF